MGTRKTLGILGLGLGAAGAYLFRRELIARVFNLTPPLYHAGVDRDIRMVMRDGVVLTADHYYPKANGRFPTILIRSGYGREREAGWFGRGFAQFVYSFAERGYHVILQTTRGRFRSEGEFRPLLHAREDGLDTLGWIARRPWFNGSVGMWGASWLGYMQWAAAHSAPDYLKAIAPSITGSQFYTLTFPDGAFGLDVQLRWVSQIALEGMHDKLESRLNIRALNRRLESAFMHLPLNETVEVAVGEDVPFYREWFEHPRRDEPYWARADFSGAVARVKAATHLVSGWYDFLLRPLLDDYKSLRGAGQNPYLTIGPWFHTQITGTVESLRQGIIWFDAHLKGDTTRLRTKPVRVFVMGANEWREMDEWPPATRLRRFFLREFRQMAEELPAAESRPDHYRYDPINPTPALGGALFRFADAGAKDNHLLESRPDVVCYTTDSLARDVEVMGEARVTLFVKSSLAHTDFFARLCDVHPDGRSINITDGLLRVEPGIGERQADGALRIEIPLWHTAHRFMRGHRIRLQVSSGAHPRWSRNLGTGEPLGTGVRMVAADQTIYHDAAHPSQVVLPVTAVSSQQ